MRRPKSVKPFLSFFLLLYFSFLQIPSSQAASVATLPSALFVERLSLGARWVYSIQPVLLPERILRQVTKKLRARVHRRADVENS